MKTQLTVNNAKNHQQNSNITELLDLTEISDREAEMVVGAWGNEGWGGGGSGGAVWSSNPGVAESSDDFAQFETNFQCFQPRIHPAFMQRRNGNSSSGAFWKRRRSPK